MSIGVNAGGDESTLKAETQSENNTVTETSVAVVARVESEKPLSEYEIVARAMEKQIDQAAQSTDIDLKKDRVISPDGVDRLEEKLKTRAEGTLNYYRQNAIQARRTERFISTTLMILSVLAPAFVVSSTGSNGLGMFGVPQYAMQGAALVTTILTGVLAGLNRIFHPFDRWSTCALAQHEIKSARDDYRISRLVSPASSIERLHALDAFRRKLEAIEEVERGAYFKRNTRQMEGAA